MAYADARTIHDPTTGQVIPAAWGDQICDNQDFFATPPMVRVRHSLSLLHASSGSWLQVGDLDIPDVFDTVSYDTDAMWDPPTTGGADDGDVFTVNTAGKYIFGANASINAVSDAKRWGVRLLRGTVVVAEQVRSTGVTGGSVVESMALVSAGRFTVGQQLKMELYQDDSASEAFRAQTDWTTVMWMHWSGL